MDINTTFNLSLSDRCSHLEVNRIVFLSLLVFYALLTPLFGYVLLVGYSDWSKRRSGASKGHLGHSDVLTISMVAIESVNLLSVYLLYLSLFHGLKSVLVPGDFLYMVASYVQASFHCLICVERYLAVLHPVTYLRWKNKTVAVVTNVTVVVISSSVFVTVGMFLLKRFRLIFGLLFNFSFVLVVSFCSVSVLRALVRPAPGDGDRDRKRFDRSKRSAFDTIMIILGVLVLRFLVVLIYYVESFADFKAVDNCMKSILLPLWLKMPSSLVLPLLFLHRAGKLPGCRTKA